MLKYLNIPILTAVLMSVVMPSAASPASDFSLPSATGELSLKQFKGKIVYLDFWASWCSPCIDSFPWMESMQQKYRDQDVVFLAVNVDRKRNDAEKFLLKNQVSFPVAFDSKGETASAYRLQGMPSAVLIDRAGEIRHTHVGFNLDTTAQYEAHIQQLISEVKKPGDKQ